ncbi:hypothetical protein [Streptomyces sp. NPDC002403]
MAEKLFPVAELARALAGWLDGDRDDFEFDSMSCAESGEVRDRGTCRGMASRLRLRARRVDLAGWLGCARGGDRTIREGRPQGHDRAVSATVFAPLR